MNISSMSKSELKELIIQNEQSTAPALLEEAFSLREKHYGNKVFVRGLIEISNYCKKVLFYHCYFVFTLVFLLQEPYRLLDTKIGISNSDRTTCTSAPTIKANIIDSDYTR